MPHLGRGAEQVRPGQPAAATGHREAGPQGARLHVGSYGDGTTVARLLTAEGIEAILHCAARSLVSESIADPARYFRDNVAGGITLLEAAREVVKFLKDQKLKKVQAAIQGDQLRVTSPSKDELQTAIRMLKGHDFGIELQFGNFRE